MSQKMKVGSTVVEFRHVLLYYAKIEKKTGHVVVNSLLLHVYEPHRW